MAYFRPTLPGDLYIGNVYLVAVIYLSNVGCCIDTG